MLEPGDVFLALLVKELGLALVEALDHEGAQREVARALQLLTAALGPDHPQTVLVQNRLGARLAAIGDYAAAEKLILDALQKQEGIFGSEHPMVASSLISLGVMNTDRGDLEGAERALQRAAAIVMKWYGTNSELFWGHREQPGRGLHEPAGLSARRAVPRAQSGRRRSPI